MQDLTIRLLADTPGAADLLAMWFTAEWPDWYGPGGPGDARADLAACLSRDALPVGVAAWRSGELLGFAALKEASVSTRPQYAPWAAAGFVRPEYRRQGVGARLLTALEDLARARGAPALYCGTATSASLLARGDWTLLECFEYHGAPLHLFRKDLRAA